MIDTKICVVGLGGVGGYVGGMMALHLNDVSFYTRGARLASIQKKGLSVCSHSHGNFTAYPKIVSDQAADIGCVDYVILAVKHFSLEQVIPDILPMIGENTVLLPLLNGVGNADKVKKLIPKGHVFDGLIYIVSYSTEDFTVQHTSPYGRIHFGLKNAEPAENLRLKELKSLLDSAQISNKIEDDIDAAVWRKYILNCAFNIVTAYYKATTGDIKKDARAVEHLHTLLVEGCMVARRLQIRISEKLEDEILHHILEKQSNDATSSLKRDMEEGKETELEIFSGHMLQMASNLGIQLPLTKFFYTELLKRNA